MLVLVLVNCEMELQCNVGLLLLLLLLQDIAGGFALLVGVCISVYNVLVGFLNECSWLMLSIFMLSYTQCLQSQLLLSVHEMTLLLEMHECIAATAALALEPVVGSW